MRGHQIDSDQAYDYNHCTVRLRADGSPVLPRRDRPTGPDMVAYSTPRLLSRLRTQRATTDAPSYSGRERSRLAPELAF